MSFLQVKNNASSTLASAITDTDTSLSVASGDGSKFPSSTPFHITIDDEILEVTAVSTDTFTVTRASESTTAASHSAGASVELRITAEILSELQTGKIDIPSGSVQGDILIRNASGWTRLSAGTSGQYLKTQGSAADPAWATVAAGGMKVMANVTLASAASYIEATGLNLQSDGFYRVYLTGSNDVNALKNVSFCINGDTTVTDYYTNANGTKSNNNILGQVRKFWGCSGDFILTQPITDTPATYRVPGMTGHFSWRSNNTVPEINYIFGFRYDAANLTSIRFCSADGNWLANTRLIVLTKA